MTAAISAPFLPPGRYELDELLAAGGFGQVWRATDLALGRPVAVKVLHPGFACHPETLDRFRAEARHTGSLSHENIARVYDYGEPPDGQGPYLVMELVEGPSLAATLAAGPLDPARVLDIVTQTAAGLDAAHRAGLVHRDIKPSNLMLSPDGLVKITDFGISYAAGSAPVTSTGQLVGTPGYLAPERVRGARAGPPSDLYSLGIVAWECLAGQSPFTGTAVEVAIAHRDRPLPPLPASVPPELAALIGQLTAKDPAARPATAGDLARQAADLRERLAAGQLAPGGSVPYVPVPPVPVSYGPSGAVAPSGTVEMAGPPVPEAGPAGPGRRRARRAPRRSAVLATAAAAMVTAAAGLVLAGLLGQGGPHRPATLSAGAPTKAAAVTIEVSGKSLVGQPVTAVVARLRKLGLKVRVRWEVTGQQPPGHVVSVQPGGLLPPGSLVTVTGAVRPAGPAPGHVRPPARPAAPASRAPGTSPPATSAPPAAPAPSGSGSPGTPPPAASGSPAPPDPTGGGSGPPSPAPQGSSPAADPPGVLALR